MTDTKRHLPSVDRLLLQLAPGIDEHGRQHVTACTRAELAAAREGAKCGLPLPEESALLAAIRRRATENSRPNLRAVFNLTGTVLHTNLGRAQLAEEAIALMVEAARSPCALEYDLASGGRGDRDDLITAAARRELGGARATGRHRRQQQRRRRAADPQRAGTGQGGRRFARRTGRDRWRLPHPRRDAPRPGQAGRNRHHQPHARQGLHRGDHGPKTALLMKIHTSNYAVTGFTKAVDEAEVGRIAHAAGLPFVVDLGSGTLADFAAWGLPAEPTPQQALAAGADLVTFSGDKLLGGPQAGLIVGRRELIAKIKKNPLKRALRVGKTTLAALEATLHLYRDPDRLTQRLPTLRLLTRTQCDIEAAANRLAASVQAVLGDFARVSVEPCASQIGSGALPVERLPSTALVMRASAKRPGKALLQLEAAFRALPQAVIGYVKNDAYHLDLRCLEVGDEARFAAQLGALRLTR